MFDRIDVLGMREATVRLSEHAVRHGLSAALPTELGISVSGRGERIRTHRSHASYRPAALDQGAGGRDHLTRRLMARFRYRSEEAPAIDSRVGARSVR